MTMIGFFKRIGDYIDRTVFKPIVKTAEAAEIWLFGDRWWIVGPMGSGKTTMHNFLVGSPIVQQIYEITRKFDKSEKGISHIKSKEYEKTLRVKSSTDYGGDVNFWKYWEQEITKMHRFVFLYSLTRGEGNFTSTLKVISDNGVAKTIINEEGFKTVEDALKKCIDCLIVAFHKDGGKRKAKKYRKLLILCNKIDLWTSPSNPTLPTHIPFYDNARVKLDKVILKKQFEEKTNFEVIHGLTSFNDDYEQMTKKYFSATLKKFIG